MRGLCLIAIAAGLATSTARAESVPTDCSKDAAPEGALTLKIGDRAAPLTVARMRSQQEMSIDEESFEVFALSLRDAESISPPHEVAVSVMVKKGESLDGKTFRRLPVDDMKQQPTPVTGEGMWMPEEQSIEVNAEAEGIEYEHGVLSSVRIEFGKREGELVPGRIRLCIAAGRKDETFLPEPTQAVVVEGKFEARLGL